MKPVKSEYLISLLALLLVIAVYLIFTPAISSGGRLETGSVVERDEKGTIAEPPVKMDYSTDPNYPQVLHSDYSTPIPVNSPVNTAGIEDSPFITPDSNGLYYFYTPETDATPRQQARDGVTGIWYAGRASNGMFQNPDKVFVSDGRTIDGCPFMQGDTLWFCSARRGNYRNVDMYSAHMEELQCEDCENLGKLLNKEYEIGELYMSAEGDCVYFHSNRPGGQGGSDIWITRKIDGNWQEPENIADINTCLDEGYPFLSGDGLELWYTRPYLGSSAIFRSVRAGLGWSEGVPVISGDAYSPSLDDSGNIYFAHRYIIDGILVESDIFVSYKRSKG